MTIKLKLKRPLFGSELPKRNTEKYQGAVAAPPRPFIDTLTACAGPKDAALLKNQQVYRGRPLVQTAPAAPAANTSGTLQRAISWLRGERPAKRLRVAETVSLGEKRFVAILEVDERKYLIGGGPTGVALLSQLDEVPASVEIANPSRYVSRLRGTGW